MAFPSPDCATFESAGSSKNPGRIALASFGNLGPLSPALTERNRQRTAADMAERLNIAREVAALKRLTVKELRGRYVEVFGERHSDAVEGDVIDSTTFGCASGANLVINDP